MFCVLSKAIVCKFFIKIIALNSKTIEVTLFLSFCENVLVSVIQNVSSNLDLRASIVGKFVIRIYVNFS